MTYKITFRRGEPKTIILKVIYCIDYFNGHLYYSDGNDTRIFHVDEIESSERIAD